MFMLLNFSSLQAIVISALGRVKNPKFMEQVFSVCKPDDHLIVDFKNVCNMGGGYLAWVENGFTVTKPSEEKVVL
ncbi:unnamed protein product [Camellia sinensis]